MSGAGRGTPRVSAVAPAIPVLQNLGLSDGGDILDLGGGLWRFRLGIAGNAQVLTGTFAEWQDGNGAVDLQFPRGAIRGLITFAYAPADGTSQLEVYLKYTQLVPTSGFIHFQGGSPTFPNAGEEQGATVPIAVPVFQTQVSSESSFNFGLPFAVPAGTPDRLRLMVREIGTAGGTLDVTDFRVENFG